MKTFQRKYKKKHTCIENQKEKRQLKWLQHIVRKGLEYLTLVGDRQEVNASVTKSRITKMCL